MNQTRKREITRQGIAMANAGIKLAEVCKAEADSFWKLKEADQQGDKGGDIEEHITELENIISHLQDAVLDCSRYFVRESKTTRRAKEFAQRGE
jgi:hypothetical protein